MADIDKRLTRALSGRLGWGGMRDSLERQTNDDDKICAGENLKVEVSLNLWPSSNNVCGMIKGDLEERYMRLLRGSHG